jgi:DNA-binding transcriptional ArsR family regulator
MNPDAALKAIADPNRRAILRLVSAEPRPVGDIAAHFDITPQAVSRHLRVLRDAGLVEEHREGTRHLFVVRTDGFQAVRQFLDDFWGAHLSQLKSAAESARRGDTAGGPSAGERDGYDGRDATDATDATDERPGTVSA